MYGIKVASLSNPIIKVVSDPNKANDIIKVLKSASRGKMDLTSLEDTFVRANKDSDRVNAFKVFMGKNNVKFSEEGTMGEFIKAFQEKVNTIRKAPKAEIAKFDPDSLPFDLGCIENLTQDFMTKIQKFKNATVIPESKIVKSAEGNCIEAFPGEIINYKGRLFSLNPKGTFAEGPKKASAPSKLPIAQSM